MKQIYRDLYDIDITYNVNTTYIRDIVHRLKTLYVKGDEMVVKLSKDFLVIRKKSRRTVTDIDLRGYEEVQVVPKIVVRKGKEIINPDKYTPIFEKYPLPRYLDSIKLTSLDMDILDSGLVYLGIDKIGKTQYIYGSNHVLERKEGKQVNFVKVYKHIDRIKKFIEQNYPKKKPITQLNLMAILLMLELKTFIRTGRDKYDEAYGTEGIRTLKTKSILLKDGVVRIEFIGKKKQKQVFVIDDHRLIKAISMIYNPKNEYLFTDSEGNKLKESVFYKVMNSLELRLKDVRTYGVNILLLETLYNKIKKMDGTKTPIKKIFSQSIKEVAEIIGHTTSISKSSYVSESLLLFVEKHFKEIPSWSLDKFIKEVSK